MGGGQIDQYWGGQWTFWKSGQLKNGIKEQETV